MDVKLAGCLFLAILTGWYSVDATSVQCALLATDCALNMTDTLTAKVDEILADAKYICRIVDDFKKCLDGDGKCGTANADAFDEALRKMDGFDIDALCGTGPGGGGGGGGGDGGDSGDGGGGGSGVTSVLSMIYTLTMLAICFKNF